MLCDYKLIILVYKCVGLLKYWTELIRWMLSAGIMDAAPGICSVFRVIVVCGRYVRSALIDISADNTIDITECNESSHFCDLRH
jgi:hypothetical protein